jgi:hypothetical protein
MRNEIVIDQLILLHKSNKKVSEKMIDYLISQTKHPIIVCLVLHVPAVIDDISIFGYDTTTPTPTPTPIYFSFVASFGRINSHPSPYVFFRHTSKTLRVAD